MSDASKAGFAARRYLLGSGGRGGCAWFGRETAGDPLAAFPALTMAGRPYNLWLADTVLVPLVAHWGGRGKRNRAPTIGPATEWAAGRSYRAFREILSTATKLGDPAVLAALAVTANLQRTLATLGEAWLTAQTAPPKAPPEFILSRLWCGLIEFPRSSAYFPGGALSLVPPRKLSRRRIDARHLRNVFRCPVGAVHNRCDGALAVLRREIPRRGFTADDLRFLRSDAVLPRFARDGR